MTARALIALSILCLALAGWGALQTWRIGQLRDKADRLDTCEEVRNLNQRIRNETDDDLLDRVSRPGGL